MLQIWFCRSGLCFCNFFVLTYVTAGVSHHMFSPGFLPRVLPQYFYDSVSHVCRCFNRGCSFLAADAAASSFTLGSCATCFSTGSSVLLLPCEFTFLWSILLRLQMGYSFATLLVSVGSLPRLVFIYVPPAYALLVPRYFSRRFHIMWGDVT